MSEIFPAPQAAGLTPLYTLDASAVAVTSMEFDLLEYLTTFDNFLIKLNNLEATSGSGVNLQGAFYQNGGWQNANNEFTLNVSASAVPASMGPGTSANIMVKKVASGSTYNVNLDIMLNAFSNTGRRKGAHMLGAQFSNNITGTVALQTPPVISTIYSPRNDQVERFKLSMSSSTFEGFATLYGFSKP
jgi:hypothetical protein